MYVVEDIDDIGIRIDIAKDADVGADPDISGYIYNWRSSY